MKHWIKHETLTFLLVTFFISYLVFFPIYMDLSLAFAGDTRAPVISHYPTTMARYGQQMTIKAHVADQSSIQSVSLIILGGQQPMRGKMPEIVAEGNVPVQVRVRRESRVYSGPGSNYQAKGVVRAGEMLQVSQVQNGYYRIVSDYGVKGYVYKDNADILLIGQAYGVTLPASVTSRPSLTYQIEAVDILGNKATTEPVQVQLLTPQQVQNLAAQQKSLPATQTPTTATAAASRKGSESIVSKPWFWAIVVAAGVGIYFLLSGGKEEKTSEATVDVTVEWE